MGKLDVKIGFRIREIREQMKFNREEFAEKAKISPDFLYDIETAKKDFTTRTLKNLCEATNVSADFILFGNENQSRQIDFLPSQIDGEEDIILTKEIIKTLATYRKTREAPRFSCCKPKIKF